jgi:hypothetical protein
MISFAWKFLLDVDDQHISTELEVSIQLTDGEIHHGTRFWSDRWFAQENNVVRFSGSNNTHLKTPRSATEPFTMRLKQSQVSTFVLARLHHGLDLLKKSLQRDFNFSSASLVGKLDALTGASPVGDTMVLTSSSHPFPSPHIKSEITSQPPPLVPLVTREASEKAYSLSKA